MMKGKCQSLAQHLWSWNSTDQEGVGPSLPCPRKPPRAEQARPFARLEAGSPATTDPTVPATTTSYCVPRLRSRGNLRHSRKLTTTFPTILHPKAPLKEFLVNQKERNPVFCPKLGIFSVVFLHRCFYLHPVGFKQR